MNIVIFSFAYYLAVAELPLPKMVTGDNAFNILTLDNSVFWYSIIAIPF
jgi:hypothetical protein